tara:strand:- start:67 stop:510 length:444 start_codon:yes stop_codon:yes gene_type:complete
MATNFLNSLSSFDPSTTMDFGSDITPVMAATDNGNFIRAYIDSENDFNMKKALDDIETGKEKAKLGIMFDDQIQGIQDSTSTLSGLTDLVSLGASLGPGLFPGGGGVPDPSGLNAMAGSGVGQASITPAIDAWKPTMPALSPYAGMA